VSNHGTVDGWAPRDHRDAGIEELEEENERLRADRDGFKDIARNQRKLIEAALALHKTRMGGPFCPECGQEVGKGGYCTSPTVKALKGEK